MRIDQFLASKSLSEATWLGAREGKITATLIANAHTEKGRAEAIEKLRGQAEPIPDNAYMEFGRRMEPFISLWIKSEHSVLPNDWLISHAENPLHVATPDGVSFWEPLIAEVKTTGKDWGSYGKVPANYKRQVQWQMYVTGAERCVFAWLLREERDGRFFSSWLEPKHVIVERDDDAIAGLVELADSLLEEVGS